MKKTNILILTCLLIIITFIFSSIISCSIFYVNNPIVSFNGLIQIICTDKEYIEIQEYPKVIIAKPNTSLDEFMIQKGYIRDEAKQMGSVYVYSNELTSEYIRYSVNQYYSVWRWQE